MSASDLEFRSGLAPLGPRHGYVFCALLYFTRTLPHQSQPLGARV